MNVGITSAVTGNPSATIRDLLNDVARAEADGFSFYSMPNIFGFDSVNALSMAAIQTHTIELMSGVVPATPKHPVALAQQVLTAQAAANGRFTLGVGISHEILIKNMLGLPYSRIVKQMSEYLAVLTPLLQGRGVSFTGDFYTVKDLGLKIPVATPTRTLLAALGPQMLELAAKFTDGTITWMAGARTLSEFTVPTLQRAFKDAGRTNPRVVALMPIALTHDKDNANRVCNEAFAIYGSLPVYKVLLQRENAAKPSDVALIGNEAELRRALRQLRDSGVTDFGASLFPADADSITRTREFLLGEINAK
jgi:5,10-methylenetetrahydromethanopterin reductase